MTCLENGEWGPCPCGDCTQCDIDPGLCNPDAGHGTPCEGQVNLGLGETTDCQECIAENCCYLYQLCSGGGDCSALFDCADPDDGLCGTECFYLVCTTGLGHEFAKTCVDCLSSNCCTEYQDCWLDVDCRACLLSDLTDASPCDAGTLDEDVRSCESSSCCVECDIGGCGGAGGSGGQGGAVAGGSGGAGGSAGQGG